MVVDLKILGALQHVLVKAEEVQAIRFPVRRKDWENATTIHNVVVVLHGGQKLKFGPIPECKLEEVKADLRAQIWPTGDPYRG